MDVQHLDRHLHVVNGLGYTLNIEEKLRLEMAVNVLEQSHPHIDEFKFWGRIDTLTKPYYIVMGLQYRQKYEFPHKTFFWASVNFVFSELPEPFEQHREQVAKFKLLFSGDPNKMLVEVQAPAEGDAPADEQKEGEEAKQKVEDDDVVVLPKKNFLQLHRLSITVRAIENDCQIVPIGAYKMLPVHELAPNRHFLGLKIGEANNLESWLHFRAPQNELKRRDIQNQDVIFRSDFLDSIEDDLPQGCWSIQNDITKQYTTVRSLKWLGYFAYQQLQTGFFGSAYFGQGLKNSDLAFML